MCQSQGRLDGRLVVITGANSGIGLETTIDLVRRGATIVLACRDITLGDAAKKKILKEYGEDRIDHNGPLFQNSALNARPYYTPVKPDQLIVEQIDLSSLESVRQFAERVKSRHRKIDYLINNAGIYMQPFGRTREGFERNVGVNYLGPFLLTLLLLPSIKEAGAQSEMECAATPRFVNTASLKKFSYMLDD
ncbi:unnamed protein product [Hymenolepis diminuta]|uniref:Retinol dehydrogenase 12 n=1 Tax=Hymenolepis diminuta TaxID=6216 RepID=A0A0R3SIS4_HYMDI|nr:unnamed protein product [Hymenolepis diminuta]